MRLLIAVIVALLPFAAVAQEQARQLTVNAEAQVSAVPDMATVTLAVETQARTAAAALAANSTAMAALIDTLKAAAIAPADIQTSGLSLNPVYAANSSTPQITGYEAQNQVTVRVLALDGLGGLLDSVVAGGANRFYGLNFGLQDPIPLADQALARAIARAREKAGVMAMAAGVTLGPVVAVSESSGQPIPGPMLREMAVAAAPPIAGGEVAVSAQVTLVYALQ